MKLMNSLQYEFGTRVFTVTVFTVFIITKPQGLFSNFWTLLFIAELYSKRRTYCLLLTGHRFCVKSSESRHLYRPVWYKLDHHGGPWWRNGGRNRPSTVCPDFRCVKVVAIQHPDVVFSTVRKLFNVHVCKGQGDPVICFKFLINITKNTQNFEVYGCNSRLQNLLGILIRKKGRNNL